MYCFLVSYFLVFIIINQSCRRWIIFKTFKRKILSSSSSKASESFINSTYSFLALFTYCFMHGMMNPSMFIFHIISCDLRLRNCVWVVQFFLALQS
jgi:hypothetical protein